MYVTALVGYTLVTVGSVAAIAYLPFMVIALVLAKGIRLVDRRFRRFLVTEFKQTVSLPLVFSVEGALIAVAVSIWVEHPPWSHSTESEHALILFAAALLVGVVAPFVLDAVESNPKNLVTAVRVERLRAGDWTRDSVEDVVRDIGEQRARIVEHLSAKKWLFVSALAVLLLVDAVTAILLHIRHDGSLDGPFFWPLVCGGVAGSLIARFGLRPIALRSQLADLDLYRAEVLKFVSHDSGNESVATAAPAWAAAQSNGEGWLAVGGVVVGMLVAYFWAARRSTARGERRP